MRTQAGGGGVRRAAVRALLVCAAGGAALWFVGAFLSSLFGGRGGDLEIDARPVLLAIRAQGELRTVSFEMKDVLRHESEKSAEGWLTSLPGVDGVVRSATHNEALVVATGSVDAGVDLRRIAEGGVSRFRRADGSEALRVELPPVTVYPPNVTLNVQDARPGVFWNDRNIVPKAEAEASRRFTESAEASGIRAQAREKAVTLLKDLLAGMGHRDVEFVDASAQAARLPETPAPAP